jgi:hypothetical protein
LGALIVRRRFRLTLPIAGVRPTGVLVRLGRFKPVRYLNRQAFFSRAGKETGITQAQVAAVFQDGRLRLSRSVAAKRLQELTGRKKTLCYEALRTDGKFGERLSEQDGHLAWKP